MKAIYHQSTHSLEGHPEMKEPDEKDYHNPEIGLYDPIGFDLEYKKWQEHIASLKTYPVGVPKGKVKWVDGQILEEGDFYLADKFSPERRVHKITNWETIVAIPIEENKKVEEEKEETKPFPAIHFHESGESVLYTENQSKQMTEIKTANEIKEKIETMLKVAYYDGFNQSHYSSLHPDQFPVKECQSAGEEYLEKNKKWLHLLLEECKNQSLPISNVEDKKETQLLSIQINGDNIFNTYVKLEDIDSVAEHIKKHFPKNVLGNVDEAAEKFATISRNININEQGVYQAGCRAGFKAGAEWYASQQRYSGWL